MNRRSVMHIRLLAAVFALISPVLAQSRLRDDLASRQRAGELVLSSFARGSIYTADFSRRDRWVEEKLPPPADHTPDGLLSPDGNWIALSRTDYSGGPSGNWLAVMRRDGTGLVEFTPFDTALCWSHDSKRLIVRKNFSRAPVPPMLLDLVSSHLEEINVPARATFSSQCWSPDGQRLVYHTFDHEPPPWTPRHSKKKDPPNPGTVFIYDIAEKRAHALAPGQQASWSPDGEWIAYWSHGAEWRMSLSSAHRQRLFKQREPDSPLIWSPDSRLVLYFRCCSLIESLRCMCDVGSYFVRRLVDNAEVRVGMGSPFGPENVWIETRSHP